MPDSSNLINVPVGKLGIIPLQSCMPLGEKVDSYIAKWRAQRHHEHKDNITFAGYEKDSYILKSSCPRFGSGEAKGTLSESVRGTDLYLLVDVVNHNIKYSICGETNMMSPDDHYSDLKRVIAAIGGKSNRITVIMPFLYESRQHKRNSRESLDCAIALQELVGMGVDNIITFDAHDPRVQNAIPRNGFENIMPTYQFIKTLLMSTPDLTLDSGHMMVISPDEGAMNRAIYFANHLAVDVGMFYKRRDYTTIVNGKNPIVAHEFLGDSVEGKDVIIVDDMIASGESMLDVARELKRRKAKRVYALATFGLFTNGLEIFDKCHEDGIIEKVITTNLTYQSPELFERPWYNSADLSKYIAILIDHLNHNASISQLLDQSERIQARIQEYKECGTITPNYKAPDLN
ncbi:MAG: ribose-phosphate pyrophosphokinase [Clostridium sp.]|nr:ribose-phosphate pyrophosphokinase [Clostridium sp.]MCM1398662.1 ribose-phosphate pyrophosphokinase [Clostridium sp.]MCM1459947.1 ribose-phosphate pyrophosphokinase [Bacteroides sp.]